MDRSEGGRSHQSGIAAALEAESKAMLRQAGSPENIEAVRAFIEKRPPNFRDLAK
jgi:enoyl-CoA hydratase/carnithine racemase